MSFPKYIDTSASGVGWLGDVPAHWTAIRLDRIFEERREEPQPDAELISAFIDGVVTLRTNRPERIVKSSGMEHGYKRICSGDLVISGMNAHLGGLGISDSNGKASPIYIVLKPKVELNPSFMSYLLRHYAMSGYIGSLATTIRYNSADLKYADVRDLIFIRPPLSEQTAIAAFLDRETGKIDALVEKQKQLIAMLKEKRQAIISHTVTKGLNPDAPMRNSGVEWLGEVPEHWEVSKLKWHSQIYSGTNEKHEAGEVPLYGANGVIGVCSAPAFDEARVLVGRVGSAGAITLATGAFGVSDNALIIDQNKEIDTEYLFFAISLIDLKISVSTTAQPLLTASSLKEYYVPIPPLAEQVSLVASLKQRLEVFDGLSDSAECAILLLQERRSALISAAVTGKIDVRGLVPDQAEAA